jgi:hypothetical protein
MTASTAKRQRSGIDMGTFAKGAGATVRVLARRIRGMSRVM